MLELQRCLTAPPKDELQMREYLFGKDRTDVLGKVEEAVKGRKNEGEVGRNCRATPALLSDFAVFCPTKNPI
jgi:hypothetical protein